MIVLDTHALVWWVSHPARLGARARRALDAAVDGGERIAASSISVWEIAMLVKAERLKLTMDVESWLAHVDALPMVDFIAVDNRISLRAVNLENFPHRDPADRIIVSTALGLGAPLLTADERMQKYAPVRTIWK